MADFVVPSLPDDVPVEGLVVTISTTFGLEPEEASRLEESLGERYLGHANLRIAVPHQDGSAEIRGLLGIHRPTATQEELFDEAVPPADWLHYSVTYSANKRTRAQPTAEWELFAAAIAECTSPRPVSIDALWALPRESIALRIALPIPIKGDIPGFSEIRGVRLAQPDPEDPDADLYAVIINQVERRIAFQVRASHESAFSPDMLDRAFERAFEIASLTYDCIRSDE